MALAACATPAPVPTEVSAPAPSLAAAPAPDMPTLKRKVAIGRFSNSTNYGRALLLATERDPLADQAADMLSARLVESGKFMVFERSDLDVVRAEQALQGSGSAQLVGVDALIIGSVTEFGRKTDGQTGFLSSTKRQTASATVEVRLVDVHTGRAFFSTSGHGDAVVEAGEIAGFGSNASYDGTLNDRAIAAAVADLMTGVMQKLQERSWSTDILQVKGGDVLISGGPAQGLKIGDRLRVERPGQTVTSGQTGLPIALPGDYVATLEIVSFFGDQPEAQGAVTRVVEGKVNAAQAKSLIVTEIR
ncbi:CsgG/HfaB family protein [Oleomonas cavernae]|nr:CsgG/HfaB family protein [Oleomonas cavernae]